MASCCGAPWQLLFGKRQQGKADNDEGGGGPQPLIRSHTISQALIERTESLRQDDLLLLDMTTVLLRNDAQRPFSDEYKLLNKVGSGAFGSVFEARSKVNGQHYAVKVMGKMNVKEDKIGTVTELEAMISLRHPNVLNFYEFFETKKCICLVVELCDGGDFRTLYKEKTPEMEVQHLFRDVFMGVSYCHAQGICHRDLKMENVLICDGGARRIAKIIDFGLAAIRKETDGDDWMNEAMGTKFMVAPEVLDPSRPYGLPCDLWSMGVMLYIVLTNEHPFAADALTCTTQQLFNSVRNEKLRTAPLDNHKIKKPARSLIEKLLNRNMKSRISAEKALEEGWLRPKGYNELSLKSALGRAGPQELMKRINSYGSAKSFERVMRMIVAHKAKRADVEAMRAAFVALDRKSDGTLTKEELLEGIKACGGRVSSQEIDTAFNIIDANHSGQIDYNEWLSATLDPEILDVDSSVKDLFHFLDSDGDGSITKEELRSWVDEEEASRIMSENDTSHDGLIDLQEFTSLMHKMAGHPAR